MKTTIDIKSALVGLCIGVVAMLAIGASSFSPAAIGRYQLGGTASQGLVIDSTTGQVWSKFFPQQSGYSDMNFEKVKNEDAK